MNEVFYCTAVGVLGRQHDEREVIEQMFIANTGVRQGRRGSEHMAHYLDCNPGVYRIRRLMRTSTVLVS